MWRSLMALIPWGVVLQALGCMITVCVFNIIFMQLGANRFPAWILSMVAYLGIVFTIFGIVKSESDDEKKKADKEQ